MINKIIKVNSVKLSRQEILSGLEGLSNWRFEDAKIVKSLKFKNFENTCGFLSQLNMRSHILGHHPAVKYCYNSIEIELSTHDVDGVSNADLKLAKQIDSYEKIYM